MPLCIAVLIKSDHYECCTVNYSASTMFSWLFQISADYYNDYQQEVVQDDAKLHSNVLQSHERTQKCVDLCFHVSNAQF